MHALVITDGKDTVIFPKTKRISHEGEIEGTETVMSDGTKVIDVIGFRPSVTYEYDYLPQSVFDVLMPMLRKHRYITATVLDVNNVAKTSQFAVEYPSATAFKLLKDGGAVWHEVTIKLTKKEVEA